MPIISDDTGFLCPMPNCGGLCHVDPGSHNQYGTSESWARRIKICPECGCRFGTLEQVTWVNPPLFANDDAPAIDRRSELVNTAN